MNAVEYVNQNAASIGYCGRLRWSDTDNGFVPSNNYPFMAGRVLSEDERDLLAAGSYLQAEVRRHAKKMKARLIETGRAFFKDSGLPLDMYDVTIDFSDSGVTCKIWFKHRETGFVIGLTDVYFDNHGNVLQAVMAF